MYFRTIVAVGVLAITLAGCTTPQMDSNASQQVLVSTPKNEGTIKFFTSGQWMPNSKEFNFINMPQKISGVIVVTDKSILFQQWGGATGLTIIKKISFEEIQDASLINWGIINKIVIQNKENQYDSFTASELNGEGNNRTGTIKMHEIISGLVPR